jgi:phage gp36-like protein
MAYITNADIEQRMGHLVYVQLTDDAGSGSANEAVVTEARLGAEGEMDSFLGRRCAVPVDLTKYPELAGVLKSAALDLAEYRLHARRSAAPAEAKAKHDAALRWLQRIAAGEALLPTIGEPALNPAAEFAGRAVGAERVLTRSEMKEL